MEGGGEEGGEVSGGRGVERGRGRRGDKMREIGKWALNHWTENGKCETQCLCVRVTEWG